MVREATLGAKGLLRSVGLKVTRQRMLVLEILSDSEGHLDADAIHQLAREGGEEVSLATVYRTLRALREAGIVEQRFLGRQHDRERYEAVGRPEHYHFTCHGCGQVFEFETERIHQMKLELGSKHGWVLDHSCLCLEGWCASCVEEGKDHARAGEMLRG